MCGAYKNQMTLEGHLKCSNALYLSSTYNPNCLTLVGTILLFRPMLESIVSKAESPMFISASVGHVCSPDRPSAVASKTRES